MTEVGCAKQKCFLKPLPFGSQWKRPSPRLSTSWAAGAERFTDILSDPHNILLGRYCCYLHLTDEVIEFQKGLVVAGARWHRE